MRQRDTAGCPTNKRLLVSDRLPWSLSIYVTVREGTYLDENRLISANSADHITLVRCLPPLSGRLMSRWRVLRLIDH